MGEPSYFSATGGIPLANGRVKAPVGDGLYRGSDKFLWLFKNGKFQPPPEQVNNSEISYDAYYGEDVVYYPNKTRAKKLITGDRDSYDINVKDIYQKDNNEAEIESIEQHDASFNPEETYPETCRIFDKNIYYFKNLEVDTSGAVFAKRYEVTNELFEGNIYNSTDEELPTSERPNYILCTKNIEDATFSFSNFDITTGLTNRPFSTDGVVSGNELSFNGSSVNLVTGLYSLDDNILNYRIMFPNDAYLGNYYYEVVIQEDVTDEEISFNSTDDVYHTGETDIFSVSITSSPGGSGIVYESGVDYSVNGSEGTITPVSGGDLPTDGTILYLNYTYTRDTRVNYDPTVTQIDSFTSTYGDSVVTSEDLFNNVPDIPADDGYDFCVSCGNNHAYYWIIGLQIFCELSERDVYSYVREIEIDTDTKYSNFRDDTYDVPMPNSFSVLKSGLKIVSFLTKNPDEVKSMFVGESHDGTFQIKKFNCSTNSFEEYTGQFVFNNVDTGTDGRAALWGRDVTNSVYVDFVKLDTVSEIYSSSQRFDVGYKANVDIDFEIGSHSIRFLGSAYFYTRIVGTSSPAVNFTNAYYDGSLKVDGVELPDEVKQNVLYSDFSSFVRHYLYVTSKDNVVVVWVDTDEEDNYIVKIWCDGAVYTLMDAEEFIVIDDYVVTGYFNYDDTTPFNVFNCSTKETRTIWTGTFVFPEFVVSDDKYIYIIELFGSYGGVVIKKSNMGYNYITGSFQDANDTGNLLGGYQGRLISKNGIIKPNITGSGVFEPFETPADDDISNQYGGGYFIIY